MNVRVRVDALRDDSDIKGKLLSELFPKGFFNRFSYNDVEVKHCLHCKRSMTHNEREPPDKLTPRAMHVQCFAEFTNGITEVCPICEGYLSNDKVNAQSNSPYDIHHRICEGRCMDYFSIVSCKALGDDMSFLADEQGLQNFLGSIKNMELDDNIAQQYMQTQPPQQIFYDPVKQQQFEAQYRATLEQDEQQMMSQVNPNSEEHRQAAIDLIMHNVGASRQGVVGNVKGRMNLIKRLGVVKGENLTELANLISKAKVLEEKYPSGDPSIQEDILSWTGQKVSQQPSERTIPSKSKPQQGKTYGGKDIVYVPKKK